MIDTLIILFSLTIIAMMSPGPDMLLIIKHSKSDDQKPAIACITGICLGLFIHTIFSILGLTALISASELTYRIFKYVGALYLIYLGIKSLRPSKNVELAQAYPIGMKNIRTALYEGLFCNLLNPKVGIFILAVFSQVIETTTSSFEKLTYGIFISIEVFIVWNLFALLVRTKYVLSLIQNNQITLDRLVGILLIGLGFVLILESLAK